MPALNIFESSLRRGKFDANRKLSDGSMMEFAKVYPLDAVYDKPEDVPEAVRVLALILSSARLIHKQLTTQTMSAQMQLPAVSSWLKLEVCVRLQFVTASRISVKYCWL